MLRNRLASLFTRKTDEPVFIPAPASRNTGSSSTGRPAVQASPMADAQPDFTSSFTTPQSAPYWLADETVLRDEGVLFGLANAQPDEKTAEIRSYFADQTAALQHAFTYHSERVDELRSRVTQYEQQLTDLRTAQTALAERQPGDHQLVRTLVELAMWLGMGTGTFLLVANALLPTLPNPWMVAGIFLAGMFAPLGFYRDAKDRTSSTEPTAPDTWRMLAEVGLSFTASTFILAQVLPTQPIGQAIALFAFVFMLFLVGGRGLSRVLANLTHDLTTISNNRRLTSDRNQLPTQYEARLAQLTQELITAQNKLWPALTELTRTQTELTRLNARGDQLVNLFLSEYELARSLRDRISEQQRTDLLRDYQIA